MKDVARKISVAEMAPHIHSFASGENKVEKLSQWLINWIESSLKNNEIKPYDFLPSKGDLACHIGVSQGTIQNVYRKVEDAGYIESKQRIGTYIRNQKGERIEKLTSKRESAIETVKKYILENNYKIGDVLISTRQLAKITKIANTTIRIAITTLADNTILEKKNNSYIVKKLDFDIKKVETKTLAEKTAERIKKDIISKLNQGDKLPSNTELKNLLNVSVKTIHDAVKILSKEGVLFTRRGQYGTIVSGAAHSNYHYEKVEEKIRHYIYENCKSGDKLPSIRAFSSKYNTSEKTVKKALDNLREEGYIAFTRGRFGGTFVLDIPQINGNSYTWLAINSEYIF